ncbi:P antigen family member 3-like [Talpa occidentalis]|uniref:P antigen family member 3-like n=1 Tax=Talpa occidentalis TaxID=50954 RepID=UPI00188F640E|nr:P antigen family member 3-like [Talpa occidentalis]
MSEQLKTPFKLRGGDDDKVPLLPELVGPTEQPQKEEPPTEMEAVKPGQDKKDGASVIEDRDLEAIKQELTHPRTGRDRGGEPHAKGRSLINLEPIKMPELDEEQLKF